MQAKHRKLNQHIVLESPFAQVDFTGNGIRQVYLAFSKSNFIICNETLPPANRSILPCKKKIDPEAECIELDQIIPLLHCEFHLCSRYQRLFINVILHNDIENPLYFEFGAHIMRSFYHMCWSDCIMCMPDIKDVLYKDVKSMDDVTVENEKEDKFKESSASLFVRTQEKVQYLKRRVTKLSQNIKRHVGKDSDEEIDEKTNLLTDEERRMSGGDSEWGKKPLIDLYKKSPRQSDNSVDNIWL